MALADLTTSELLVKVAPGFSGDADIDLFVEIAASRLSPTIFGTQYRYAVALFAAHMLEMRDRGEEGAGATPVTSERAGEVARSYAAPKEGQVEDLDLTTYGRQYKSLRDSRPGTQSLSTWGTTSF